MDDLKKKEPNSPLPELSRRVGVRGKIKVGAVSYLNTKPLIYGFEHGVMENEIELVMDYPAKVAQMLIDNTIDIGLIPVAAIPQLKEHYVISDYCIGCNGEVASVCLFSEVPVNEIETILLDYQSKTSVALLKILLKEYWKIDPKLVVASANYEKNIVGKTAGLVIGDRAFKQRLTSAYIYDLGTAWKALTGLPFVFAAWVSNKKIDEVFVERFNVANKIGFDNLDEIVQQYEYSIYDLNIYYRKNIQYKLDEQILKNIMNLFYKKMKA